MSRFLALLAASLLLGLGLVACGGGDDDDATTADPDAVGAAAEAGSDAGGGAQGGSSGGSSPAGEGGGAGDGGPGRRDGGQSTGSVDLSVRPETIESARVTETGAVQTLPPSPQAQETADENTYGSIRSFGEEAEGEEATNITFGLIQYLDAKARGDWETVCARIYSLLRENLEDPEQGRECPEVAGQLISRIPKARRVEQAKIDVSSVRRGEGNRAFVIYKTPKTLSADMPMYVEEGVWKVGALEAYVLRPEQLK